MREDKIPWENQMQEDKMQKDKIQENRKWDNEVPDKKIQEALNMAEAVIFDIGNVLAAFAWEDYLRSLGFDEETYEHVADAMFRNEDWYAGDSGLVTTDEWLSLFIENDPAYEKQIRYTFEHFGGTIVTYEYTKPWIMRLKEQRKKVYFLSNYSKELYRQSKEQLNFLDSFDGGLFSWEERCMKPDERIYRRLMERYCLCPEKCVFFDDRMENVEGARKAGIKAFLFHEDIPLQFLEKSCNIYRIE